MTPKPTIVVAVLSLALPAPASDVVVEWPGRGKDATRLVQKAIDSGAERVVLESHAPDAWMLGPVLCDRSDQTIVLEAGCRVRAKRGEFVGGPGALFTVSADRPRLKPETLWRT